MVRCKNVAGSSQPPLETADIAIFENEAAEERYLQIHSKQLLQEKGFVFSTGERFGLPQEVYDVVHHGWEKFAKHPDEKELQKKSINVALVKEFYAHFTDPNQGTMYVRSERVEFTAKAINSFFAVKRTADLHTPFVNNALLEDKSDAHHPYCHSEPAKAAASSLLITALCRQKGVMKDETDFYIRGRQGIKPTQIPSLMGFDEDATVKAPPGGARTIAAARLAELMALTEKTQEQVQDMQEKMTYLFHYMRERDEAIQSYFLELLPDEAPLFPLFPNELFHYARPTKQRAPQEQATPQPAPAKKNVASTSIATPQPQRNRLILKDKGKAPTKPAPRTPIPEATFELDSDDDNDDDMPDIPQPPAPTMETSIPRRRLKRKANRNISTSDLAAEENDASDAEDDGSSTTPEETPMTSPP
ncbi:hypothetical protein V6N11_044521 [Hibiscus sabdariffa]|uniref:Uncharacterized protein n=1 Tax=Hibiscus sabdariffa TaxID=183260 RepID=A0ABR2RFV0_9ROSI